VVVDEQAAHLVLGHDLVGGAGHVGPERPCLRLLSTAAPV